MLYELIPNMPETRLQPLIEQFVTALAEQTVFNKVFGVV
jgi:hypothetical protein